jgi:L-threonylcarbamoyladenylate synthase
VTLRITIDPDAIDEAAITGAARTLADGGLVAFPTETVYGLGGRADRVETVERIYAAKQRPDYDPLIVHVVDTSMLDRVISDPPDLFFELAERFWPGPLTLVVGRGPAIPPAVTSGLSTVAVRSPDHPVARALLRAVGLPIAAPSANTFGHVSPTNADHVLDDLAGRCDLVLDAGDSTLGIESTVLRVEDDHAVVLRHGALPIDDLEHVDLRETDGALSESPGRSERHYAPETPLAVMDPRDRAPLPISGGVYLGYDETARALPEGWAFVPLGSRDSLGSVAARLYRVLRSIDRRRPQMIVAELSGRPGLGRAIDDRLTRAASGNILTA